MLELKRVNMEKIIKIIKESKTRIIVALVMILALSLVVAINSEFLTWAVLGVVYLVAFYESCRIFKIKSTKLYGIATLLWMITIFHSSPLIFSLLTIIILLSTMLQYNKVKFKYLLPFLYPTIPMIILYTQYLNYGMFSVVWLILIAASCDVGAYFIGKAIGKTKFSSISPNKTKEGVLGGLVVGTIIGTSFGINSLPFTISFIISLAVSIAGVYGDLFESFLKRQADIKDSGDIFPGHGGMLDRCDSYLFGTIVMLAFLEGFAV